MVVVVLALVVAGRPVVAANAAAVGTEADSPANADNNAVPVGGGDDRRDVRRRLCPHGAPSGFAVVSRLDTSAADDIAACLVGDRPKRHSPAKLLRN